MDRQLAPRRSWWPALGLAISLAAALVTFGLARARARIISVAREDVTLDQVKRETLVQTVSGPGRLVPLHVRWLTATHRARVERVTMHPGDRVQADTVVAVLQNSEIDLALLEAERQLAAARI
jgi:multidrug efflux pump subunit AcrA (membrane-fusion protein)